MAIDSCIIYSDEKPFLCPKHSIGGSEVEIVDATKANGDKI